VLVNSQPIAAMSTYQLIVPLGRTGYQTLRGILRGPFSVDIQGHVGAFFVAAAAQLTSGAFSFMPYGLAGYTISYLGGYSRLHGDSYLSHDAFGNGISLRDAYISGANAILEFYNKTGVTNNLSVYGVVAAK